MLLAFFSGSDFWLQPATWIREPGHRTWTEGAQFFYTLLSAGIISRLIAIFLTD